MDFGLGTPPPSKKGRPLHFYHLLKPEAGNLIFLDDHPSEHVVTAILESYLPQKNLDTLLFETAEVLRLISLFQPRRQLGADLRKRLFCDSRFEGWCGIGHQSVVVVCGNRCQERIQGPLGRRAICRAAFRIGIHASTTRTITIPVRLNIVTVFIASPLFYCILMPLLAIQGQRDPESNRPKSRVLMSSVIGNQGGGGGGYVPAGGGGYALDGGGA